MAAGRIRTLSDAVHDMTTEMAAGRQQAAALLAQAKANPATARAYLSSLAAAADRLAAELASTNQHLARASHGGILGLGFMSGMGGAEGEIQKLVAAVDGFRRELSGWRDLVPR